MNRAGAPLETLHENGQRRRQATVAKVNAALEHMANQRTDPINVSSVARTAGVSRTWIRGEPSVVLAIAEAEVQRLRQALDHT